EGDDHAGRGADRLDPRHTGHPGAEPRVSRLAFGGAENLEGRSLRRDETEVFRQGLVEAFELLGEVAREDFVGRVEAEYEVISREGLVALEYIEHLPHVADADVEAIGLEGVVQDRAGTGEVAGSHLEQAQCRARRRELRGDVD